MVSSNYFDETPKKIVTFIYSSDVICILGVIIFTLSFFVGEKKWTE